MMTNGEFDVKKIDIKYKRQKGVNMSYKSIDALMRHLRNSGILKRLEIILF